MTENIEKGAKTTKYKKQVGDNCICVLLNLKYAVILQRYMFKNLTRGNPLNCPTSNSGNSGHTYLKSSNSNLSRVAALTLSSLEMGARVIPFEVFRQSFSR